MRVLAVDDDLVILDSSTGFPLRSTRFADQRLRDDLVILDILSSLISHLGHEITTASSGEDAIELCYKQQFDIAIVDYTMPGGIGGKDTSVAIKGLQPSMRVIICSGYGDNINEVICDGFMPKPFTIKDLDRLLKE